MKGIKKKCLSSGLLFGLFLTAFFIGTYGKTYAVINANYNISSFTAKTDFLPCGNTNTQNKTSITSANSQINFNSADSWIFEGSGGTVASPTYQQLWYAKAPNKITAYFDSSANNYKYKLSADSVTANSWLVQSPSATSYNAYGQGNTQKCYYSANNITYESSWNTAFGGFTAIPNGTGKFDCDTWDIACKIKNVFTGIADTFIKVGEAITNGISLLFSPDTTTFELQFNELTDFFSEKLGFLFYPIEWLLDTLGSFVSSIDSDAGWGTSSCAINSIDLGLGGAGSNFMGGNIPFDKIACNGFTATLATATRVLFPPLISLGLIHMFRQKIHDLKTKA